MSIKFPSLYALGLFLLNILFSPHLRFIVGLCRLPYVKQEAQQYKLLYLGLYLLIWGEAANLRFMPECLCYIFHHVS